MDVIEPIELSFNILRLPCLWVELEFEPSFKILRLACLWVELEFEPSYKMRVQPWFKLVSFKIRTSLSSLRMTFKSSRAKLDYLTSSAQLELEIGY